MKTFVSTLCAILVAAAIIWFVASVYRAREASEKQAEEMRQLTLNSEIGQAEREWNEQTRRDPQFDPNADKLTKRLIEIREASEAGKPIPPNPWQADSKPEIQSQNTATLAQPVSIPRSLPTMTLVKSVSIQTASGTTTLQAGTSVGYISRHGNKVWLHYGNADYEIPIDATDLK